MQFLNAFKISGNKIGAEYDLKAGQDYFLWLVSLIMKYKIFPEFPSTF